ncbi:MAG: ferric uptake regulator, Fur family [Bacillota bacterium]|jgi:Fur family ferric uptake transcriptional regulator|nr:ferric uptake regulator, Fur family [Bacillota bacterium]
MIEEMLKNAGLKKTKQRNLILEIIKSSSKPITAEKIFEIIKSESNNTNLSTIYRTLNILCEKSLLLKILKSDGTASYQLNDASHKHYITCCACQNSVLIDSCPIKDLSDKIVNETGYIVTGHSIELTGICPKCNKK